MHRAAAGKHVGDRFAPIRGRRAMWHRRRSDRHRRGSFGSPCRPSDTARFTATVVVPTPPLPAETTIFRRSAATMTVGLRRANHGANWSRRQSVDGPTDAIRRLDLAWRLVLVEHAVRQNGVWLQFRRYVPLQFRSSRPNNEPDPSVNSLLHSEHHTGQSAAVGRLDVVGNILAVGHIAQRQPAGAHQRQQMPKVGRLRRAWSAASRWCRPRRIARRCGPTSPPRRHC